MQTGGPIRGFISRWLVRFEASQQLFQVAFLGVTAASTFTSVLFDMGYQWLAPYVLSVGGIGSLLFAYAYVEGGIFNRKNRERADRGDNFAAPGMAMGNLLRAKQLAIVAEALADDRPVSTEEIQSRLETETLDQLQQFRDGIDLETVFNEPRSPRHNGQQPSEVFNR